ncbi:MAG: DUF4974 domain-containing protein [Bacteroidaceae bacterium]|nr:DUF4974 domain-containing protein [Bacteroidaceae bacterium]
MHTNDKKRLFLDMQEHPERYTDEELETMMDELDRVPDVEVAWQKINCPAHSVHRPFLPRVAAIFIGVLLVSGIAFAAIHHIRNSGSARKEAMASAVSHDDNKIQSASVVFNDVRLDSILTVVSSHYGKKVEFSSKETKDMKFIMTWKPDSSLTSFLDLINMFDGLHLSVRRDTIFVETKDFEEDDK